jgi:predicted DNA-binding transcriptional regulator AlpA
MASNNTELPKSGFIRGRDVAAHLSVSERSLAGLVKAGAIPAPVRLGHKTVRWNAAELRRKLGE